MTDGTRPSTLQLILWPSVITLVVSVLRVTFEVQEVMGAETGGRLAPLGISWLAFVFGAWFALRLRREGGAPRVRFAPLFALLLLVGMVAAVVFAFSAIDRADRSAAAFEVLRGRVLIAVAMVVPLGLATFAVWSRLAAVLLVYAIPARLTVIAITGLAKASAWETHYTKFGPGGIETDMAQTMVSAAVAQLGFWVPFTLIAGGLAGTLVAAAVRPRSSAVAGS